MLKDTIAPVEATDYRRVRYEMSLHVSGLSDIWPQ